MTTVPFRMPSLGADMEEGTLVEWMIEPGQHVARGDIVAVVETVKGAVEIEVFEDAEVERLLVDLGQTVPVGAPIAEFDVEGAPEPVPAPPVVDAAPAPSAPPATGEGAAPAGSRALRASPAARAAAAGRGVDLASVTGTGPGGAIVLEDVEAAAARKRPDVSPMEAMRQAIGQSMARSKREIPHYYLSHHVDVTTAAAWLSGVNEGREPDRRLLLGALFVKAVASAARANPSLNGHFDGSFRASEAVHVGVAVALRGGGLTAPAIHDADKLTLDETMDRMRDLIGRARAGRLRASEMSDPTITVSSLGDRGVEAMTAVIMPPQVAIVAFGTPLVRPWVHEGAVAPRTVVGVTLSADHRVSDGRLGSRFLTAVEAALATPEEL